MHIHPHLPLYCKVIDLIGLLGKYLPLNLYTK